MKTSFCFSLVAVCACYLTGCANGLYNEAIKANTEAIERNPNDAKAYEARGSIKKLQKDYPGAMADLRRAIELNPKNGMAYANCADIKLGLKDYEGAIPDAENAIKLNQSDSLALAYINRGLAKFKLKDMDAAIGDYDNAIKAIPLLPIDNFLYYKMTYRLRAQAKKQKGDVQGARADNRLAQNADLGVVTMPSSDPGAALMPGVNVNGPGVQPAFNATPQHLTVPIPAIGGPGMGGLNGKLMSR